MPGIAELIEQQRQKRRAQLDRILAGGAPQQGALNFQPVPLPQSKGSSITGALWGDATRAAVGSIPTASAPQASAQTYSIPSGGGATVSGTPGGRPLSPPQRQPNTWDSVIRAIQSLLR